MTKEELIRKAYQNFSVFKKPERCVRHDDDCPECRDHEQALKPLTRETLSMDNIGTVAWGPISNLNPKAMAYFLPGLIELAVSNANNRENDPYINQFIFTLLRGPEDDQFQLLEKPQINMVLEVLRFIKESHTETVSFEGYYQELESAIEIWDKALADR
jgi:hypothetical protein